MTSKQARYEASLDAQQVKQQTRWFRDATIILEGLTKVIQDLKMKLSDCHNFEAKTLPKLRDYYKIVITAQNSKHDYNAYRDSGEAIGNMISCINSWYRRSKVAVGIKAHADYTNYGNAQIADWFELLVSDDFDVTRNRGF